MKKAIIIALTWGAALAAALTGTGCVRHWDDHHDERYEHHDDRHGEHERYEHRS